MKSKNYLILDFANLAAILRFGLINKNADTLLMDDEQWKNYFLDSILVNIANYINVLGADEVIITVESKSWRKTYYPLYKANRDKDKEEDEKLELFYEAQNLALDFLKDFTHIKVIKVDEAEGDDIVAVLTQKLSLEGHKVTIVSTDGDFKQLLKHKNVKIFNPIKKVYLNEGYSHRDYIEKIIKGDRGDNIPSSYPRIKKELLDQFANDERSIEDEFKRNEKMMERQKFFIAKFLGVEEIPEDFTEEEWFETIKLAKEKKDELKEEVKKAKEWNEFKDDPELVERYENLRKILKLAKSEGFTESTLFKEPIHFRSGFERNKKLISLDIEVLPEHVVDNIIKEFEKDHKPTKQGEYLKFVRSHKLKEFAFGNEWNILKSVGKDNDE